MAFTAKLLGEGQLPAAKGTLYTVPSVTETYVKTMRFHNIAAQTQTVQVYLNGSGTSRKIYQFTLAQDESAIVNDNLTLEAADLIEASSSSGSSVDYTIHGVEQT
jgi:hypothetical protein